MNHSTNKNNPHEVTKAQVGLGNVPNVSTNNQTPTYSESSELNTLQSGETLKVAFSKIKKAIDALISHLFARNPHNITTESIGAAVKNHKHSANDITTGAISVEKGGTGCGTLKAAAVLFGTEFLKYGSRASYSSQGADGMMDAGFFIVDSSNGGTSYGPVNASKYYMLVLGDGRSSVIQIAIVPDLYKTTPSQNTIFIRQIDINTFNWSNWEAII